jgi:4a-hydroxytetrahydrobiopterin dehydratase
MAGKFDSAQIQQALNGLPGWAADGDSALTRTFKFKDHIEAMGFVTRVAMAAEVMDHHPDLRIVYNTVTMRLNSHDAGGVTDRDVKLAEKIGQLAG